MIATKEKEINSSEFKNYIIVEVSNTEPRIEKLVFNQLNIW